MTSTLLRALTLLLLMSACVRQSTLHAPVVGSPFSALDAAASTQTEPTGDVPVADLERMSANAQLRWGTEGTGGLAFSFHNHLEQEVDDIRLRLVIRSEGGEVLSDRTYEWSHPVDALADSATLNLPAQRVPQAGETLIWGLVGATKR